MFDEYPQNEFGVKRSETWYVISTPIKFDSHERRETVEEKSNRGKDGTVEYYDWRLVIRVEQEWWRSFV